MGRRATPVRESCIDPWAPSGGTPLGVRAVTQGLKHHKKTPSDTHLHPPPTVPRGHARSSHPQGPRGCRGIPARRSAHSTPFPTAHPTRGRLAGDRHRLTPPHPPGGPAPAASPRRAAGVCTAKWRLCTEPARGRAALISRKHIISRNASGEQCRNPSPRRAHPAGADKSRRQRRAPPLPGILPASDGPADPEI